MTRAVARSIVIVVCTLAFGAAMEAVWIVVFCPAHRAWQREHDGRSPVVTATNFGVARPGDAIYACTTDHTVGSLTFHRDLTCVCAPASLGPDAVGLRLSGRCVVDEPAPARADTFGICRNARCATHVDR